MASNDTNAQTVEQTPNTQTEQQSPRPDRALKRLDRLVGTWIIKGRTFDSPEDNISGRTIAEWLPGGFFLQLRGEMEMTDFHVHSLEIIGYDPVTDTFPSTVYSDLGGVPSTYHWDVQGDVVTHWDETSKYTGRFSEDGNTLVGGWRPKEGQGGPDNVGYDAIMTRVQSE